MLNAQRAVSHMKVGDGRSFIGRMGEREGKRGGVARRCRQIKRYLTIRARRNLGRRLSSRLMVRFLEAGAVVIVMTVVGRLGPTLQICHQMLRQMTDAHP